MKLALVSLYLPHLHDLVTLAGVLVATGLMAAAGALIVGNGGALETRLVAGWGAFCVLLTLWGTLSAVSLAIPTIVFCLVALLGWRSAGLADRGFWRIAVLTLPLWAVMVGIRPSQVDTWLNLLPNAAYIVDHGVLPTDQRPQSYSFLPGAPYNTQFVGYLASLVTGQFLESAMSLFNILLQAAAGLLLARVLVATGENESPRAPGWFACALGFLLAVPLNPGFVPRVFFAPYGEAPLAVTLMIAVWLGAELLLKARSGAAVGREAVALGLVLAVTVNIKQSGLGLVLPFLISLAAIGLTCPGVERMRWLRSMALAAAPSLLLYFVWRWFVLSSFAVGELKMLPIAAWHIALIPRIVGAMLYAAYEKLTFFLVVTALIAGAVIEARRRPWTRTTIVLALGGCLTILFDGFLFFTYVAHFPTEWALNAHSYFRYMSQLSLVVMLGMTMWLAPPIAPWFAARSQTLQARTRGATIVLLLLLPIAFIYYMRFDLVAPQPTVWDLAKASAALLKDGDRVALVMPGDDDDGLGSMLRGVILFTPPRRHALDFMNEVTADEAALAHAAASGYTKAIVTCSPPGGLGGLPGGVAGLITLKDGHWQTLAVWPYPAGFAQRHFQALIPRSALCADTSR